MSHFTQIKTKLSNRECLIKALNQMGLEVEVHEKAIALKGYYGSSQGQSAEIIIPGKSLNSLADIGFRLNQEINAYEVIHDPYETNSKLGRNFFTHTLMQVYGEQVIESKIEQLRSRLGKCTVTQSQQGDQRTVRLTFTAHQERVHHIRR